MSGTVMYNILVTGTDAVEMEKMTSSTPNQLSTRGGRTGPIPSGAVSLSADA